MAGSPLATTLTRPYDEAVAAVRAALGDQGFDILTEIDVATKTCRARPREGARQPDLRRHPQRPATARQHVPSRPQRGGRSDRRSGPSPPPAAAHRGQPRDRQRRRHQGDPADARAQLGDDDARHLRPPLRGPPRRGRQRDGRRPSSSSGTAYATRRDVPCCPSPSPKRRETPTRPLPAFPLVRTAFRLSTPDRIRTGATALRGRRARPLHNGGLKRSKL